MESCTALEAPVSPTVSQGDGPADDRVVNLLCCGGASSPSPAIKSGTEVIARPGQVDSTGIPGSSGAPRPCGACQTWHLVSSLERPLHDIGRLATPCLVRSLNGINYNWRRGSRDMSPRSVLVLTKSIPRKSQNLPRYVPKHELLGSRKHTGCSRYDDF